MKRRFPALVPCSELHLLNKTMIIEVPSEFRKPGQPIFRIVSSFDDLEKPSIQFKANEILKAILEKGTEGKKLDSICIEGGSLQSTQPSHEKSCEKLSNGKVSSEPQGLEVHKDKQKASSSVSMTGHVSVLNSFQKAIGDYETIQPLSKPVHRASQGQGEQQSIPLNNSEDQSLTEFHDYDSKTTQQMPCYVYSDTNPKNVSHNNRPSWSKWKDPCRNMNKKSHSSPRQTGQSTGYSCNNTKRFSHQKEQQSRTLVHIPRVNDKGQRFSQVPSGKAWKLPREILPAHVFQKNHDLSEVKQILFLDVLSYPNFFLDFVNVPPIGTHIWAFMSPKFKLKFPETPVNCGLLNMKLLHVMTGDICRNIPNMLNDLHHQLLYNVPFTIVSRRQFSVVKSIVADNRTVHIVPPGLKESINHVYQALYS